MILGTYRLKKDLPQLSKGVIFEHRAYDFKHPDRGNIGTGCMILAWDNGSCQRFTYKGNKRSWCGETYVFPGQLANDAEWFERIDKKTSFKDDLREVVNDFVEQLEKLYKK